MRYNNAFFFKSNLKLVCKKNVNLILKLERKCQPRSLFKYWLTNLLLMLLLFNFCFQQDLFLNYLGFFNLVIFCAKSHYKILNEKSVTKQSFYKIFFLVRGMYWHRWKIHYDLLKNLMVILKIICKLILNKKLLKSFV